MKTYVEIVAPRFLNLLSMFSYGSITAITFAPFVFSAKKMDEVTLNHEFIHIKQQQEFSLVFTFLTLVLLPALGYLTIPVALAVWLPIINPFYLSYVSMYLVNLVKCNFDGDLAYRLIPFEMEAYRNEKDKKYLMRRSFMAWWGYI